MTVPLLLGLLAGLIQDPAGQARADSGETGRATFYASFFHGRRTASGTTFDSTMMIAAHPTLPFGTTVRVHCLRSGRSVVVTVVDRGPAKGPRKAGVVIDLSPAAARYLAFEDSGHIRVRLEVLEHVASVGPSPRR